MDRLKDVILLDCPFCGHTPYLDDIRDVIYPTGGYWKYSEEFRSDVYYSRHNKPNDAQEIYKFLCQITHGGCGAQVTGKSFEETIAKWNRRV